MEELGCITFEGVIVVTISILKCDIRISLIPEASPPSCRIILGYLGWVATRDHQFPPNSAIVIATVSNSILKATGVRNAGVDRHEMGPLTIRAFGRSGTR